MQSSSFLLKLLIIPSLFTLGIPLGLMAICDVTSLTKILVFIPSVIALEYLAIPIGLGLGLPPMLILVTVLTEGIGVFMAIVEGLEILCKLRWLSGFIARVQKGDGKSFLFRKYGIYGLAPAAVYSIKACAVVAWLAGWPKWRAMALTMFGLAVISAIVLLSALGLLKVSGAFPGV